MKTVTNKEFLEALEYEVEAMFKEGTPYRHKTAELSLKVFNAYPNVDLYRDRQNAYEVAVSVLSDADEERLLDVAQALNALLAYMERKLNLSDEVLARVKQNADNYKLVPVEPVESSKSESPLKNN